MQAAPPSNASVTTVARALLERIEPRVVCGKALGCHARTHTYAHTHRQIWFRATSIGP
jgi:hypothetical protein